MKPEHKPILHEDEIPGGSHWSFSIRRGKVLRLIDQVGGANVGMMFFNPHNLLERYNAPDTLKCQHTFKLTRGHCLYSDMGRIFCSILDDSLGWHDTVGGNLTKNMVESRWGKTSYQAFRNDWNQDGETSFLVEAAKYGLGRRDLVAPVNWFSKVTVGEAGEMTFAQDHSQAGSYVDLRFEMDALVLLHTCPHPMNLAPEYPKHPLALSIREADKVAPDDYCRTLCPENERGFRNTEFYTSVTLGSS